MLPDTNPTVPGEPNATPVVKDTTQVAGGVGAMPTPSQTPVDADALKRDFEATQRRLQADLNKMKSTFQSREAQLTREARERERALRAELDKTRIATMDDETRKAYENELAQSRIQELEESLQEAQTQLENMQVTQNAIAHFRRLGVPDDVIVSNNDLDTLLASGWDWVSNRLAELNKAQASVTPTPPAPTPPATPSPLPIPPAVDTGVGAPPSTRPTWDEIVGPGKRYTSREEVYEQFEQRRIPPEAVPLE